MPKKLSNALKNWAISIVKKLIKVLYNKTGLVVQVRKDRNASIRNKRLNLNIGCGPYFIPGFVSVDYIHEKYHGSMKNRDIQKIKHYDMRGGKLNFSDQTVDNIYISHVIEHIEREYVDIFF